MDGVRMRRRGVGVKGMGVVDWMRGHERRNEL